MSRESNGSACLLSRLLSIEPSPEPPECNFKPPNCPGVFSSLYSRWNATLGCIKHTPHKQSQYPTVRGGLQSSVTVCQGGVSLWDKCCNTQVCKTQSTQSSASVSTHLCLAQTASFIQLILLGLTGWWLYSLVCYCMCGPCVSYSDRQAFYLRSRFLTSWIFVVCFIFFFFLKSIYLFIYLFI